jgi:hypothetical protein
MPLPVRRLDGSADPAAVPRRLSKPARPGWPSWLGVVLPLLAVLWPAASRAALAPAGPPGQPVGRIAVLPLEIIGDVPAGRPALETAVARGLLVSGSAVTIGPDVGTALSQAGARVACVDPGCWIAAGRALGARHLLAGVIERKGGEFHVEFRLVDASPGQGRVILSETNKCDVSDCSVAELSRLTVHELARSGLPKASSPVAATPVAPASGASGTAGKPPGSLSSASAQVAPPATAGPSADASGGGRDGTRRFPSAAPPPPSAAPPASLASGSSADAGVSNRRWPSWFPIAAVATGAVAGAVGGYLIYTDDKCIGPEPCEFEHANLWPGVATVSAGAILLATGIVVGLVDGGDTPAGTTTAQPGDGPAPAATSLSIGPGSIRLSGRF